MAALPGPFQQMGQKNQGSERLQIQFSSAPIEWNHVTLPQAHKEEPEGDFRQSDAWRFPERGTQGWS